MPGLTGDHVDFSRAHHDTFSEIAYVIVAASMRGEDEDRRSARGVVDAGL